MRVFGKLTIRSGLGVEFHWSPTVIRMPLSATAYQEQDLRVGRQVFHQELGLLGELPVVILRSMRNNRISLLQDLGTSQRIETVLVLLPTWRTFSGAATSEMRSIEFGFSFPEKIRDMSTNCSEDLNQPSSAESRVAKRSLTGSDLSRFRLRSRL